MKKSDNISELFPVVDEDGNVVGSATRGECHSGSMLLHPVVHLHVFDSQDRLFLQLRPEWKDIQPGKWDTAVGGHVDFGESIEDALRREAKEELGLTEFTPEFLKRYVFRSSRECELVNSYRIVTDTLPVPSDELAGGRFWTMEELRRAMGRNILTPNLENELRLLFSHLL